MKQIGILLIITSLICGFNSFGQQPLAINNNIVTTELPAGTQKITKEQAVNDVAQKFNNETTALIHISGSRPETIYQVGDIIVSLYIDNKQAKDGQLVALKKGLDGLSKEDASYTSVIKNISGNNILITHEVHNGLGHYSFFSFNYNTSKSITGSLIFKQADSEKATTVLDYLLKRIKFTDN